MATNEKEQKPSVSQEFKTFVADIQEYAKAYGWRDKEKGDSSNAILRENLYQDKNAPFFGFILPNNSYNGSYSDLSFVVFPNKDYMKVLVAIGVGTNGFVEDYEIASMPKWRRLYLRLLPKDNKDKTYCSQCKISFSDIETSPEVLKKAIDENNFSDGIWKSYGKLLPISFIADINNNYDTKLIYAWLAQYAKLRGWSVYNNGNEKVNVTQHIDAAIQAGRNLSEESSRPSDSDNVRKLLKSRRYVILQGAPGVGKTYLANEIAKDYDGRVFFTQFHAETSYTDFVEGILPATTENDKHKNSLRYERHKGTLVEAIEKVTGDTEHDYLLIIDEINRANLANVLGPVFYLFEQGDGEDRQQIRIGNKEHSRIPDNLYVIATMNTADRSLAVVDYALRRRFVWYTIEPKPFENLPDVEDSPNNNTVFHGKLFEKFNTIFQSYATDEELNLQPGPSYFITKVDSNATETIHKTLMNERMEYELMPLIKEYLNEGLISMAQNEFAALFYEEIGKFLYK